MIVSVRPVLSAVCHGDEIYDNTLIMTSTTALDGDIRDDSYHEFGDRLVVADQEFNKFIEVVELLPPNRYIHVFSPVREDGSFFWILTTSLIKEGDHYKGVVSVPITDPSYFTPDLWLAYRLTSNAYYRLDNDQVQSYIKALYFLLRQHYDCKMQEINRVVIPFNLRSDDPTDLSKIQRACNEIDLITQYGQPYHAVDILDTYIGRFGHQVDQKDSEVVQLMQDQHIEPKDIIALGSRKAKLEVKQIPKYPKQAYLLPMCYTIPNIPLANPKIHVTGSLFLNILSLGCGGEVNFLMKIERVPVKAYTLRTRLTMTQLEYTTTLPMEKPNPSLEEWVQHDLISYVISTYSEKIHLSNIIEIQLEKYGYICFIYFAWEDDTTEHVKDSKKFERKIVVNLLQQVSTLPVYDLIGVESDPLYEFGGWDYAESIWH